MGLKYLTIGMSVLLLLGGCSWFAPTRTIPELTPDAEQQQIMQDPEQVIRHVAELNMQGRYGDTEVFLSDRLRKELISAYGSLEAEGRSVARNLGQLREYTVRRKRDAPDGSVEIEVDYQNTILFESTVVLYKNKHGWQIDEVLHRENAQRFVPTPLPELQPTDEQRTAMQDPQALVRLYAELVKQRHYAAIEPILSDTYRRQLIDEADTVEAAFRKIETERGSLQNYTIGRISHEDQLVVLVRVELAYEHQPLNTIAALRRTNIGWKVDLIDDTLPQQSP